MSATGNGTSKVCSWKTQLTRDRDPPTASFPVTSKIFAVKGVFPSVKSSLIRRGWVEKKHRFFHCMSTEPAMWPFKRDLRAVLPDPEKLPVAGENEEETENQSEDSMAQQNSIQSNKLTLLRYHPPTLIWASRRDAISYDHLHKNQIVNHFNHGGFTTKVSLCTVVRNVSWTCDIDGNKIFPRCFCVANPLEIEAFIENFKLTSCFSLMKWVMKKAELWLKVTPDSSWCMVPEEVLKFALVKCLDFLASKNHDDIEITSEVMTCTNADWIWFLGWAYRLKDDNCIISEWYCHLVQCHQLSKEIQRVWPQWNIDGDRNVWILKPAAKSRGQGIKICENLTDILEHVENAKVNNDTNYIVQKYIERPFLMQGTKFDIRQWFLVTDFNPLTMWMYKDSYLRFCSVPFSLDDKDASIHLCNNAIQCRYLKSSNRLSTLPEGNMITNDEFKNILEQRGYPDAWDNIIYPHMQSILISILKSAQEQMLGRKNCFELYGADFMIDEYLRPWLIEINSSPCLAPTTTVTKKLCARVVDDTLKIVLDRRIDKKCDIGCFELAHQADKLAPPLSPSFRVTLRGSKIDTGNLACDHPMQKWFHCIEGNLADSTEYTTRKGETFTFRNGTFWQSNIYTNSHNGDKSCPQKPEDSNEVFDAIKKITFPNKPTVNSETDVKGLQNSKETLVLDTKTSNEGSISQIDSPKTENMQQPTPSLSKCEQNSEHLLKETKEITKPLMPKLENVNKPKPMVTKTTLQDQEKQNKNGKKFICPKSRRKKKRGINIRHVADQRKKIIPKVPVSNLPQKSDDSCKEKEQTMSNSLNLSEKLTTKPLETNLEQQRKPEKANRTSDGYKDEAVSQNKHILIKTTYTPVESHPQLKKKLEKTQLSKLPSNKLDDTNKEYAKLQNTKPFTKPTDKSDGSSQLRKKVSPKAADACKENESSTSQRNPFSPKKAEHDLWLNQKNKTAKTCALVNAPNVSDEKDLDFSGMFKCHTLPFTSSKQSIKNR